jgi:hypothetical protein
MSGQEVTHGRPRIFANGTIAFPKRGWEPPPVPAGYRRKVSNLRSSDAWVFLPVLDACQHRAKSVTYTVCGAATIVYHCALHGPITPPQCKSCQETK